MSSGHLQSKSPAEQLEILKSGVVDLIDEKELLKKLKEDRPLKVKAGFDPSRPDLHLGHTLVINKLRQFQELGHKVYFVVGDWTACIGDPTGQDKTRPILSRTQVKQQAKTYIQQVTQASNLPVASFSDGEKSKFRTFSLRRIKDNFLKVFNKSGGKIKSVFRDKKLKKLNENLQRLYNNKKLIICYNSDFYKLHKNQEKETKEALFLFVNEIASKITVDQILNRDDFKKRHNAGKPLYLHEFLYPVFQAYDSVHLEADVELGGTDQLFNFLLARDLQEKFGQSPQCVLTLPLLEGLDGVQKMSKSLDNFIAFNDTPKDIYGKVMKISDDLMRRYWKILADVELSGKEINSKDEKELLAFGIVSGFHGEDKAHQAQEEFQRVFSQGEFPNQIPPKTIKPAEDVWVCRLIVEAGLCASTSEARRHIQGGGIKIYRKDGQGEWKDGKKLSDHKEKWDLRAGENFRLSFGRRRFVEIRVQ